MASNPFSAVRFAPGAIPWLAGQDSDLGALLERASAPGARHQILGPHGSGKSTLLRHLEVEAMRRAQPVVRFRGSQRPSLPALARQLRSRTPVLVLIDEFAELGRWRTPLLALARASVSLVVVTHDVLDLPTLARCETDERVARHVIEQLLGRPGAPDDLERRIARHSGNMREVLFELYDEVEDAAERV